MSIENETLEDVRNEVLASDDYFNVKDVLDIIDRVDDAVERECAVGTCTNTLTNKKLFGEAITEIFECSECRTYWRCESGWILCDGKNTIYQPNYCPNCGRKIEQQ